MIKDIGKFACGFVFGLGVGIAIGAKFGESLQELLGQRLAPFAHEAVSSAASKCASTPLAGVDAITAPATKQDSSSFEACPRSEAVPEADILREEPTAVIKNEEQPIEDTLRHEESAPPSTGEVPDEVNFEKVPLSEEIVELDAAHSLAVTTFEEDSKAGETPLSKAEDALKSITQQEDKASSVEQSEVVTTQSLASALGAVRPRVDYLELRARIEETRRRIQQELEQCIARDAT